MHEEVRAGGVVNVLSKFPLARDGQVLSLGGSDLPEWVKKVSGIPVCAFGDFDHTFPEQIGSGYPGAGTAGPEIAVVRLLDFELDVHVVLEDFRRHWFDVGDPADVQPHHRDRIAFLQARGAIGESKVGGLDLEPDRKSTR